MGRRAWVRVDRSDAGLHEPRALPRSSCIRTGELLADSPVAAATGLTYGARHETAPAVASSIVHRRVSIVHRRATFADRATSLLYPTQPVNYRASTADPYLR